MSRPTVLIDAFPRTKAMILSAEAEARLKQLARIIEHYDERMPDDIVEANLADVALIIGQTHMDAGRFERARNLKGIINVKGNWEPFVDYAEAARRGVPVYSIAPVMAPAVAEMCLGFAIDLGRNIRLNDVAFRKGEDRYGIRGNETAYSLYGARVALIGYGNLGRSLRPLLAPFGCDVMAHDPNLPAGYLAEQGCRAVGLDEALSTARYIFILAGVYAGQEGFLDRARLGLIRPDASVILASRAEVTEFDAFVEMAEAGRFRAAIDVFPEEPVPASAPVRRTQNILLSSHLAGGTYDSYRRISDLLIDEIPIILRGLPAQRLQRADPALASAGRSR
jgi:phosphoglycerate dehydrogenase-like enzyme